MGELFKQRDRIGIYRGRALNELPAQLLRMREERSLSRFPYTGERTDDAVVIAIWLRGVIQSAG